jgi:hypothetical protein
MESQYIDDALALIYIGQNVRYEGLGVLPGDCSSCPELDSLNRRELIQTHQWYKVKLFQTTPLGSREGKLLMVKRMEAGKSKLEELLSDLSPKFSQFLIAECLLSNNSIGRVVYNPERGFGFHCSWSSSPRPSHLCLLENSKMAELRNAFFYLAFDWGLVVKVHDYVSKGETRDLHYVLAPELVDFLQRYLAGLGAQPFSSELEMKHRLFHLFTAPWGITNGSSINPETNREFETFSPRQVNQVRTMLNDLVKQEALVPEKDGYKVTNVGLYYEKVTNAYHQPLVDELFNKVRLITNAKSSKATDSEIRALTTDKVQTIQPIPIKLMGKREDLLRCFRTGYAVKPIDSQWLRGLQIALQLILDELGIDCIVDADRFEVGPRLVRANIKLGKGLRINKVTQASPDIANKLFANRNLFHFSNDDDVPKNMRIESVPARGMVGIYVPRDDFQAIPIGALLSKLPQENALSFVVGVNVIGEPQFSNLDSMPHLLVAGQTGAGKSVFLNTMIVSLAFQNDPGSLQFILIDPKGGLEFGPYETLPHVHEGRIIRNSEEAVDALNVAREEMDHRYNLMSQEITKGSIVRNIKEYNNLIGITTLTYRVIIIDEFADLVLSKNGKDIVEMAQAIAQKGRAAGIHIVICTQRPSVKVIPGDIKAVIPSRLSFRLPTGVDSKVILDEPGAEDLLGKGDLFLKETTHPELRRFQGALVTNEEIQCFVMTACSLWSSK